MTDAEQKKIFAKNLLSLLEKHGNRNERLQNLYLFHLKLSIHGVRELHYPEWAKYRNWLIILKLIKRL